MVGLEREAAWKHYEECLLAVGDGEPSAPRKIRKVACAPVLDKVLTESGSVPLDWDLVGREVVQALEDGPLDQSERGYWLDCDQCLDPEKLPTTLDSLRRELPDEIISELNWKADRNYVFIVQVLSLPEQNSEIAEDEGDRRPESGVRTEEDSAAADEENDDGEAPPPDLGEKELVVVVRARNSIAAAWVWERQAQGTKLAHNKIKVGPWIQTLIRDSEGLFRVAGEDSV